VSSINQPLRMVPQRRRPFPHEAEEYYECGQLGEHPLFFRAWIELEDWRFSVWIVEAILHVTIKGCPVQLLDVTQRINNSMSQREKYEAEILNAYMGLLERADNHGDPE
jgi:hypothetical protein